MKPSGTARIAGIIGWPVSQTFSPRLHGYWLEEMAIDGVLVPLPVRPEDFSVVVWALMKAGFRGVSVTIPHKEAAFAICHDCDMAAQSAGAVNLMIFHENGRIEGRNTDASGFAASLREALGSEFVHGKKVIVLGAGGAARAVVVALHDLGAGEVCVVNRSRARADQLVAALSSQVTLKIKAFDEKNWSDAASGAVLVVQATSAGMGSTPSTRLGFQPLSKSAAICEVIYNPLETQLLKRAREAGFRTVDGLGMLMHQAIPAFEAFFGIAPKVTPALRSYLEKALNGDK